MTLKNAGLGKLPFNAFAANQLWANLAVLAVNLVSWIQLAVLPAGHGAGVWDLKRWRYRLFTIAGKLISSARRTSNMAIFACPETKQAADPGKITESAACGHSMKNRG